MTKEKEKRKLMDKNGIRTDGRRWDELRPLKIEVGILKNADGSAQIEWGDTLNNPLLLENDELKKFDIVVANPPFSLDKWGAEDAADDRYNRFHRGTPPKSTAGRSAHPRHRTAG